MSKNNIGSWFEIYVNDMDRAKKFYETVLDTTFEKMDVGDFDGEMYAFPFIMDGSGASGALVKWDKQKPSNGGTIIYFDSKDCDIELAKVEAAGGVIIQPKSPAGANGYSCLIQDTEGNRVGFYSNK